MNEKGGAPAKLTIGGVIWYYLKLFLLTGPLFGVLMGLLLSLLCGFRLGMILGLSGGVFFGVCMSLILGTMQLVGASSGSQTGTAAMLGVRHRRALSLSIPCDEAFERCREALAQINTTNVHEDRNLGAIQAVTGMTMKSFGEKVDLAVRVTEDGAVEVVVRSEPTVTTTQADYGKNYENVDRICAYLRSVAGAVDSESQGESS